MAKVARGIASRWPVAIVVVLGALLLAVGGPAIGSPLASQLGAYLTNRNLTLATLLVVLLLVSRQLLSASGRRRQSGGPGGDEPDRKGEHHRFPGAAGSGDHLRPVIEG
jgi:hypothetical protein